MTLTEAPWYLILWPGVLSICGTWIIVWNIKYAGWVFGHPRFSNEFLYVLNLLIGICFGAWVVVEFFVVPFRIAIYAGLGTAISSPVLMYLLMAICSQNDKLKVVYKVLKCNFPKKNSGENYAENEGAMTIWTDITKFRR